MLTGLTLSNGVLTPELSSEVTSYGASVGLAVPTITLTPEVPEGASVSIEGDPVSSGTSWQSPVLVFGDNTIEIVVSQSGQPSRSYTLTIRRSGSQEAYLKASNTGLGDYFGHSVAISGDTLVVGALGEASSATGVDANQADNSATQSGAAYVFR